MSLRPELKLDWATHKAAKYAVEHWHYSKCLPAGGLVKIGVWEDKSFIGVVIFSRGANCNMLKPFQLKQTEGCELTRIALSKHNTPVSRIMKVALRFLKTNSPELRIIVSYADPEQGHNGGVYQASNWLYTGPSGKALRVWYNGKWSHKKTVDGAGLDQTLMKKKTVQGKHRYLLPLDKAMKEQIEELRKPYPKREKQAMDTFQVSQRRGSTDLHAPPISPI